MEALARKVSIQMEEKEEERDKEEEEVFRMILPHSNNNCCVQASLSQCWGSQNVSPSSHRGQKAY